MTSRARNPKLSRVESAASITTTTSTPRGFQLRAHSIRTCDAPDRLEAARDFVRDGEHDRHRLAGAEQDFASWYLTPCCCPGAGGSRRNENKDHFLVVDARGQNGHALKLALLPLCPGQQKVEGRRIVGPTAIVTRVVRGVSIQVSPHERCHVEPGC